MRVHVARTEPDFLGRVHMSTYSYDPHGTFRPEPFTDGAPVGYRRGQCFFCVPQAHHGLEVATHEEARELAWPTLSDEERAAGIAQVTRILDETGIYGRAREHAEAALAWLKETPWPTSR